MNKNIATLSTLLLLLFTSLLVSQEKRKNDFDSIEKQEPKIPKGRRFYMGREIAMTMHYTGAEWLIRDVREKEERCSLMLANLGVKPGMSICDMGCGNGFHTLKMAEMVGKTGTVYGVDVQPEMLKFMRERFETQGIENVVPILGSFHNPHLPKNSVDMILLVDVYHEFSHPEFMLKSMRDALKPDGVIVLVEYRLEDPDVPIKLLHKMSKSQVAKEMKANKFKLVKEFDKLPWQHMLFYGKANEKDAAAEKATADDQKADNAAGDMAS